MQSITRISSSSQSCETSRGDRANSHHKLLFLAHPFPPANSIACVRTWNIAKYLARLGWDVTVVTPHPSIWRHVENLEGVAADIKQEGITRILTGYRWRFLVPDSLSCWNQGVGWFIGGIFRTITRRLGIPKEIGWLKVAEKSCAALTAHDADVILASGPPFLSFLLARRLSDKLGRPYVLDYRDPWPTGSFRSRLARPRAVQDEATLLAGSAAVTVVSSSSGVLLDQRFHLGAKLHIITNGYDPEELADVHPYHFGHFAIVYTGTFYPPWRVISPVMAALKHLKETPHGQGREWYFHYYGRKEDHVREEAKRFGVSERVVLHGFVPRSEALAAVRGADVVVVTGSVADDITENVKGHVPAKVFEALGLRARLLVVAPPGSDLGTIVEPTGVARRFVGSDINGIASFLAGAMAGWDPEPKGSDMYAWTNIIKRLDTVLRGVVGHTI